MVERGDRLEALGVVLLLRWPLVWAAMLIPALEVALLLGRWPHVVAKVLRRWPGISCKGQELLEQGHWNTSGKKILDVR